MTRPARITATINELSTASTATAAAVIIADYAAVVGLAWAAITIDHLAVTLMAIALIAGRQIAFLNLLHAAAHYALFPAREMNNWIDPVCGYPIMSFVRPYRLFHLLHHRDIARKSADRFDYLHAQLPARDAASAWVRVWHVIVKPVLGAAGLAFVWNTIRGAVKNPGMGLTLVAYWTVVAVVFWRLGWLGYLFTYWVVPLVWLYPVFFLWAEVSDHFAVRDEARNQRGVFYALFIKGHEMYHAVHHRYPRIPFYRIRAAARCLQAAGEHLEESRGVVDFVRLLCRRTPQDS